MRSYLTPSRVKQLGIALLTGFLGLSLTSMDASQETAMHTIVDEQMMTVAPVPASFVVKE